jgi:MFS family permease
MYRYLPGWATRFARNIERARYDYPHAIWTMVGGTFINTFGSSMVFPLFTLYFTEKFGLSLRDAGLLSTFFVVGAILGNPLGGFLADRIGRKGVMLFALLAAAVLSVSMGLAPNVQVLVVVAVLLGVTSPMFQPASAAMIADLVPPERRAASYGLMRIAANAGVALGPVAAAMMLGLARRPDGTLAPNAYLPLFIGDAVTSLIFAWVILRGLRETRPQVAPAAEAGSGETRASGGSGFGRVFADTPFVVFIALYALIGVVYSQMNTTFGVYMNRSYGIPQEHYSLMLASNAAMVVLFQFPIARWVDRRDRSRMLALGAALYGLGFGLVGYAATGVVFEIAIVVITIGEMVIVPAAQTVAADLAPIDMRGRYQAVYGLVSFIGFGVGPVAAGALFDAGLGRWIWIGSLIIGLAVAAGYRVSGPSLRRRHAASVAGS